MVGYVHQQEVRNFLSQELLQPVPRHFALLTNQRPLPAGTMPNNRKRASRHFCETGVKWPGDALCIMPKGLSSVEPLQPLLAAADRRLEMGVPGSLDDAVDEIAV